MAPRRSGEAVSAEAPDEVAPAEDERRAAALALVAQDHRRLATRCAAIVIAMEGGGGVASVRECIVGLIEAAREHFVGEDGRCAPSAGRTTSPTRQSTPACFATPATC